MKSNFTFLVVALLFSLLSTQAQDCSDLFISEYIEGWSNNKSLEIYNPTASSIDASEYGVMRFQNGSDVAGNVTYLEGVTIEPYDVFVIVLDKRDPDGIGQNAPIWDELQLQADIFINAAYSVQVGGEELVNAMYFNGNDAVALVKNNGETLVDVFGKVADGFNPDGWGSYVNSIGETVFISANHTLIRKSSIRGGVTQSPPIFEILNEYDSLPANTFDQLGFHQCDCEINSVNEFDKIDFKLFPNPVSGESFSVYANSRIIHYEILDLTGKVIIREELDGVYNTQISSTLLSNGTYVFKARLEDSSIISKVFFK